ncbi:response regulator [Pseudomonas sp. ZM23]|uniref:Response regulator n=1 Tax=Pseudomonas triclosanedens TaxID=2961893 RepID=A0ABY6ZVF0_9PSED|nr:response regulator [Pseudomonas triclosanedens]MCP8466654.1 response regulator [Pseudomonas triclosanedens]MCP8471991.1 response regulator [Pseudomonas triclosanedens]MCP8474625.1 response regulator [Pseudomonas triclosanedens]WAI48000.1 response regulator [Pseudomonas triclosanedens]
MQDRKLAILVVEDHPFQLIAIQMHLNRMGFYHLTPALDADEARQACQRRTGPFDLFLCDINLPGTNGVALLEELAKSGRIQHAVLLSYQGEDELQTLEKHLQDIGLPVLACLSKPLDQAMLLRALDRESA